MKAPTFICLALLTSFAFLSCSTTVEKTDDISKAQMQSTENTTENYSMSNQNTSPGFIHTVFFWLKDDATEMEHLDFLKALEVMKTIKTISHATIGKPANTPRDVVDNSYDYAWIAQFENAEDQDSYQVDPIHLAFVKAQSHIWTKVQVYDTLPIK